MLFGGGTFTLDSASVRCVATRLTCTGAITIHSHYSILFYVCIYIYTCTYIHVHSMYMYFTLIFYSVSLLPGTSPGEEVVSGGEDACLRVWKGEVVAQMYIVHGHWVCWESSHATKDL